MRKRILITFLLLFTGLTLCKAQKISNIDFDEIQKLITDSSSTYYYPKLLARLQDGDSTLTLKEYQCLYYGYSFSDSYSPYGESDDENSFMKHYQKENYGKALPYGLKVLKENPINPKITFKVAVCYNQAGDKNMARFYANRYYSFLDAIYSSGDGKSIETAYVVLSVGDEYEILAEKELQVTQQSLVGHTDVMTLDTKSQKGPDKIKTMYFDVTKPFESLMKEFEGKK